MTTKGSKSIAILKQVLYVRQSSNKLKTLKIQKRYLNKSWKVVQRRRTRVEYAVSCGLGWPFHTRWTLSWWRLRSAPESRLSLYPEILLLTPARFEGKSKTWRRSRPRSRSTATAHSASTSAPGSQLHHPAQRACWCCSSWGACTCLTPLTRIASTWEREQVHETLKGTQYPCINVHYEWLNSYWLRTGTRLLGWFTKH